MHTSKQTCCIHKNKHTDAQTEKRQEAVWVNYRVQRLFTVITAERDRQTRVVWCPFTHRFRPDPDVYMQIQVKIAKLISSRPKNVYVSKQWSKMLCEVDCKNSMRGREIWRRALWLTHLSASISSFPISVSLSFAHTAGSAHAHTPSDLTAHLFRCLALRK